MGIFVFYFAICLMALIVRGYYRVPSSCIYHEIIDKEENTVKSIIIDRPECKCHYTNFFFRKKFFDNNNNQTNMNMSMRNTFDEQHFELTGIVRNEN